jgi:hypothetical protein
VAPTLPPLGYRDGGRTIMKILSYHALNYKFFIINSFPREDYCISEQPGIRMEGFEIPISWGEHEL